MIFFWRLLVKNLPKNPKNSIVKDLSEGRYYIKSSRLRPVEAISNSSTKFNVDEIIFHPKVPGVVFMGG